MPDVPLPTSAPRVKNWTKEENKRWLEARAKRRGGYIQISTMRLQSRDDAGARADRALAVLRERGVLPPAVPVVEVTTLWCGHPVSATVVIPSTTQDPRDAVAYCGAC